MRTNYYLYSVNSNMWWGTKGWTSDFVEAFSFATLKEADEVAKNMGVPEALYHTFELASTFS